LKDNRINTVFLDENGCICGVRPIIWKEEIARGIDGKMRRDFRGIKL
jgi:hypothetical protein